MDLQSELIRIVRPRATLFGAGVDACGKWALSFRKRDDLLFCWIEHGTCDFIRPGLAPVSLQQGDFALIHTVAPFLLASDTTVVPVDSETAVAATGKSRLTLGSGTERPVTLHAGKFLVHRANAPLLPSLIPGLVHIKNTDASLARIRSLLEMNAQEARQPGPASQFIIERLIELVLVEILRSKRLRQEEEPAGLLAGLADPVTRQALAALHLDVARAWTIDELASLCAVSRSTFAARFRRVVGTTPIAYLQNWRMALAREALSEGAKSVGEIAFMVGFQSSSAFTTAFTRATGYSPKRFVQQLRAL